MLKSPSFGTEFSICCPYIYLAHYDKLSTKEGRQELENADLRPELCRLSVGLEDPDEIKSAIAEGLMQPEMKLSDKILLLTRPHSKLYGSKTFRILLWKVLHMRANHFHKELQLLPE